MPLRDHFHPPLDRRASWEGFHGQWPAMIVLDLVTRLPSRFSAEPRVHVGSEIEIDVAGFEDDSQDSTESDSSESLAFAPSEPSVAVETELLAYGEYEVRIFDTRRDRRLVAAIELVSPANKDRPESRRVFVDKCEALLRQGVSVVIVDLVTSKRYNLYAELLKLIDQTDPAFTPVPPAIYAAACRWILRGRRHVLEAWSYQLDIGLPLPTLPLWLTENLAIPLDLETSYEATCQAFRIT
ncbi:DUF4058 family protein [Planctomicrobium piriforme]|uniref:DUF4058 domain-containing protein n=1 Tax=Planctomicrobium piriforme TaxID=1576369 RepID=A0A1I3HIS3_9PLAN|nr:DUF4058 family protein [Planctomicrobium piriforme]SFI35533.1 Protein of unknown function [Planctomicrobium piriforme]